MSRQQDRYFVLELDAAEETLRIAAFVDLRAASDAYDACELDAADKPWLDVVLVAVDSLSQLRKGYPNYFLDTEVFLNLVREVIN